MCVCVCVLQVVDDMGNVKFCLDEALEASGSWLKYVRAAPSYEEHNLAVCQISEDQVSCLPLSCSLHSVLSSLCGSLSHTLMFFFAPPFHSH